MRSIAIRIGIIAAIAIAYFIARPFISSSADTLQVGDCFDKPADTSQVVKDLQHHPCNEPHDAEVIFSGDFTPSQDNYPTDVAMTKFQTDTCLPAFEAYTGVNFNDDTKYDMRALTPTVEGWGQGDHEVTCFLESIDGVKLTTSAKKAT